MSPTLAFGDDRSAGADRCWDWITSHRWDGWSLEIVTAQARADMRPVAADDAELHPWHPDEPRVSGELGFAAVEHLRAEIDPRVALIARSWDLLAIGPRGSGLLKSLHLGSTGDWLLRDPTSPLVIARQPGPVRSALVAADGSPHARRALDALVAVPWLDGVSVHVIAVDDGRIDTEAAIGEATETLSGTGASVVTSTVPGNPVRVIPDEISKAEPDLVVMGVRGLSGIKRLVVGSTTSSVAGSTDATLLVAHALEETSG